MRKINDDDVWFWGALHEIGHLFDKNDEPNWVFNGEITANLKAIYAVAVISDCHLEMDGIMRYSLQDIYDYFYDWSVQDNGNDDRYTDKITLGFIKIAQRYGWNVFTQVFNSYWDNSYPNTGCSSSGKYNEFIDRLEYFSGSTNIRNECFSTNNWLATIEQHYPNNSIDTWQIGSPNAADVTASFNCNTGALTISGTGNMQDWIYFNNKFGNITSVIINNGVTNIGCGAFEACDNLASITIPSSVTSIRSYAFKDTKALTSLTIPNSVTTLGDDETFKGSGLTSIIIPNLVTSICEEAFLDCKNLASVTISSGVTSIGERAFSGCSSLVEIHSKNSIPPNINHSCFYGVNLSTCKLYVPSGTQCSYAAAPVWQDFNIVGAKFTITASAEIGGSISPNSTQTVNCGGSQRFDFYPNNDYEIKQVLVDGVENSSAKANGYYTFSNVTSDHSISVTFTPVTYIINVSANQFVIYPNPVQNELFIKSDLPIKKIEICDLSGKPMINTDLSGSKSINISALPSGMYLVRITTGNGVVVKKIVKE